MLIYKKTIRIICIIGTRPQFIKHAAIDRADKMGMEFITVHTSQHYDENMSDVFFRELNINPPKYQLSNDHKSKPSEHNAYMLQELTDIILKEQPGAVMVYGDTDTTLAGARAAHHLNLPVIHVEAGLRSYNNSMPEEINRVLTDQISRLLFVPNEAAKSNLEREGISGEGVIIVGDIMKDVILLQLNNSLVNSRNYHYATLHRPYNVDDKQRLSYILSSLNDIDNEVVLSIHPRTKSRIHSFGLNTNDYKNIQFIGPQSYLENIRLMQSAFSVITDSGGMQKEAYWLQKPCITIRPETEWKETLMQNCNVLVYEDLSQLKQLLQRSCGPFDPELYGDGQAAKRIIAAIYSELNTQ